MFREFMNKIRYWDNMTSKWMMRHFYFMFFQLVLVLVFFVWFFNAMQVIHFNFEMKPTTIEERIMFPLTINTSVLVFVVILNSFWLLYLFNTMQRMTTLLRDISHHISRLRIRK